MKLEMTNRADSRAYHAFRKAPHHLEDGKEVQGFFLTHMRKKSYGNTRENIVLPIYDSVIMLIKVTIYILHDSICSLVIVFHLYINIYGPCDVGLELHHYLCPCM